MNAAAKMFGNLRAIPSDKVTERILDLLKLTKDDKLLEIGTGSGKQTAVFAPLVKELHSVERDPWLGENSLPTHVYLHGGDGRKGLEQESPFDAIVVTCGMEAIPDCYEDQLRDGGRLVIPVGSADVQRLTLLVKEKGQLIPKMIGAYVRFQMAE